MAPSIRYAWMGFTGSGDDERSITVGTWSVKTSFCWTLRERLRPCRRVTTTYAGWRLIACLGGAGASDPWNVWPVTTVSIAPFERRRSSAGPLGVGRREQLRHRAGAALPPRDAAAEVDLGVEVVVARGVRRPRRQADDVIATLVERRPALPAAPATPLPFRTLMVVRAGFGVAGFSFCPSATPSPPGRPDVGIASPAPPCGCSPSRC